MKQGDLEEGVFQQCLLEFSQWSRLTDRYFCGVIHRNIRITHPAVGATQTASGVCVCGVWVCRCWCVCMYVFMCVLVDHVDNGSLIIMSINELSHGAQMHTV